MEVSPFGCPPPASPLPPSSQPLRKCLIRKPKRKNKSTEKKANCLLHEKSFPSAQSLGVEALGDRESWTICGPVNCLMSLGMGARGEVWRHRLISWDRGGTAALLPTQGTWRGVQTRTNPSHLQSDCQGVCVCVCVSMVIMPILSSNTACLKLPGFVTQISSS